MDRAPAGADAADELDFVSRYHFSTRKVSLARDSSASHDLNRTVGRGHNAMTERRVQNDLVFENLEPGMLLQAGSRQSVTKSVGIQFLPQTVLPTGLRLPATESSYVGE